MTIKTLLTAEDLLALPDDGHSYELVDGELVEVSLPGGEHNSVMGNIYYGLRNYAQPRGLGRVLSGDTGIILRRAPDTVRGPDVCFISRERLPAGPLTAGYLDVVPDLVVEVVSPGDRAGKVDEKVQAWLRAGARLVWAVYPRTRSVVVHRGPHSSERYTDKDTIDAAPVLPDFRIQVAEFFAE